MMTNNKCLECGFELWLPVADMATSVASLYSDVRFPGRLIVAVREHHERFEELDSELVSSYMHDIQRAARAVRAVTGCERVNIAILGNAEPHVHAHLIPRFPDLEDKPRSSPWDDPRPRGKLSADYEKFLIKEIKGSIENS